jgi:hypothetical protein
VGNTPVTRGEKHEEDRGAHMTCMTQDKVHTFHSLQTYVNRKNSQRRKRRTEEREKKGE